MLHSHLLRPGSKRLSRVAIAALAAVFSLGASGTARALSYTNGDYVGVFVDGTTELLVNFGDLDSLTAPTTFSFVTPTGFGADGATGAKFVAYGTDAPFSGSLGRNLSFTVENGVNPTTFDTNITGYVSRIALAQFALNDGSAPADKFFELLPTFPAAGSGGVIQNTADTLVILTSNLGSYSSTIGVSGTSDRINNQLPFETDNLIGSATDIALWSAVRSATTSATSVYLGFFTIQGNVGGASPTTQILFTPATPVPEPSAAVLLGIGLAGLSLVGRKRRA